MNIPLPEFAHPKLLMLLIIPLIIGFWEWVRHGQRIVVPVDNQVRRKGVILRLILKCVHTLPSILLSAAIILLARPIRQCPPEVERQMTNIEIVLDNSASMSDAYGPQPADGTRIRAYDAAFDGLEKFLSMRKGDAFGLTIFAKDYIHWVPLTFDTSAIIYSRPFIQPFDFGIRGWQPGLHHYSKWDGTAIGKALMGGVDALEKRPQGDKMIVLITDGGSADLDNADYRAEIINRMKALGITVFILYLKPENAPESQVEVCRETGGAFMGVTDERSFESVFKAIDNMKKVVIKTKEPRAVDNFSFVLIPTAIVMGFYLLTLLGIRFNPW